MRLALLLLLLSSVGISMAQQEKSTWYENVDIKPYLLPNKQASLLPLSIRKAIAYFELYKDRIPNKRYVAGFDASIQSANPRLYIYDLQTKEMDAFLVAHGKGSDYNNDGFADRFSNKFGSNATSLGFYLTGGTYYGDNGYSLRLRGLESSNSNAEKRAIVLHGADYVNPLMAKRYHRVGRSHGCPAVELDFYKQIINQLKNGAILLIDYSK